jgi:hypothetical protein
MRHSSLSSLQEFIHDDADQYVGGRAAHSFTVCDRLGTIERAGWRNVARLKCPAKQLRPLTQAPEFERLPAAESGHGWREWRPRRGRRGRR